MNAAIQASFDLVALESGIARFGAGERTHAVTVLDVVGADASLATADDATQEELLAGRAQFLNAQTGPFQILVRAEPVDLEGHLRRVRSRADALAEPLASIAREYVAFVQTLAQQRTLLERHCYVVVPDRTQMPAATLARRMRQLLTRGRNHSEIDDELGVPSDLARRLVARSDQTARQLTRAGLRTERLTNQQLGELFHRCWSPELARVQRLRDELAAYTTLVVGARRLAIDPSAGSEGIGEGGNTDTLVEAGEAAERLFALGTRSLSDLIAPSGYEIRRDHLRLDGQFARIVVVTAYPRLVTPGWLGLLAESDLPIELSMHVRPLASVDVVRALGIQIARLQSSRLAALRGERVADPEREIALEDAERLRERLQRGQERLFAVSLYLLLRAKTIAELDELTHRVEEQLDALLAHSRRATWEQEKGFGSCLPEARDMLLVPRNLDTSALAATMPFVGPSLAMESGMLAGVASGGQTPVLLDPFDRSLDNANLVVIAPAGAGKSFFCKLLALRQLINGVDCVIIDPEDEYRALAEAVGGQVVRIAASSNHRLNPFDLPSPSPGDMDTRSDPSIGAAGETDVLAERVTALLGLLEVMLCTTTDSSGQQGSLTSNERPVLDGAIYRAYATAGITADPATHNRRAPFLRDLYTTLAATSGDAAVNLSMRLERFVEGSLSAGLFAGPTSVALDKSLVVFQVRDLAEERRPLAIHVIAGFVWGRVRQRRKPRLLMIDEAWSLLRYPEGGAFVAAMARRARKYYLGLVTITQQVSDVSSGGHGETILANAAQVLLLKQKAETIDSASARFRLTQDERQLLLGADKGEGLLLIRGNRVPLRVVASGTEYRLATTNPRDLEQLAMLGTQPSSNIRSQRADEGSIRAVLAARRDGRPAPPTNRNGTNNGAAH